MRFVDHESASFQRNGGPKTDRASLRAERADIAKQPFFPGLESKAAGAPPGFHARSRRCQAKRGASGPEDGVR
eukprot:14281338-Alexandrium_andersonii.AAC.1